MNQSYFRGNVLQTVLIKLPSVDFAIFVCIHLLKEVLEPFLDHFPIEELMSLEFLSNPYFELFPLQNIVSVVIMLQENILNEIFAILVH